MKILILPLCIFLLAFSFLNAGILNVPGDYPTIQAALVFATTDDTVLVAPGIYYEHIGWPSTQGINLLSEYGADSTIIAGNMGSNLNIIHHGLYRKENEYNSYMIGSLRIKFFGAKINV